MVISGRKNKNKNKKSIWAIMPIMFVNSICIFLALGVFVGAFRFSDATYLMIGSIISGCFYYLCNLETWNKHKTSTNSEANNLANNVEERYSYYGEERWITCPVCLDYVEEFDICDNCGWQNSGRHETENTPSGPNKISLKEAKENYNKSLK